MICCCCQSVDFETRYYAHKKMFLCVFCGLLLQTPKVGHDDTRKLIQHYQNDDPYYQVARSKMRFFHSVLDYLSSRVKESDRTLLEIGCGFGYFLRAAAKKGWRTFGVDILPEAAMRTNDERRNISVSRRKLKETDYPANSFNAVALWDVLFIVDNPYDDLKECYRIMKPGGIIGIRVRNILFQRLAHRVLSPFESILTRFGMKPPYVFHPYGFSPTAIRKLLLRLNFVNIDVSNSILTSGDPYRYTGSKTAASIIKHMIYWLSETIYIFSGKKLIMGPSLLVWAEKPK